jgi:acyl-CoA thioester hydrolase
MPRQDAQPADGFRYRHLVEVRFRDTDAMGHVNNAVYLTYFEAARAGYYRAVTGQAIEGSATRSVNIILASARLDFRSPAFFGEDLLVACRVGWAGRSSFSFEYRIEAGPGSSQGPGRLVADGETVQVMYDYAAAQPVRLPPDLLAQLAAFEGHPIPARAGTGQLLSSTGIQR